MRCYQCSLCLHVLWAVFLFRLWSFFLRLGSSARICSSCSLISSIRLSRSFRGSCPLLSRWSFRSFKADPSTAAEFFEIIISQNLVAGGYHFGQPEQSAQYRIGIDLEICSKCFYLVIICFDKICIDDNRFWLFRSVWCLYNNPPLPWSGFLQNVAYIELKWFNKTGSFNWSSNCFPLSAFTSTKRFCHQQFVPLFQNLSLILTYGCFISPR